MQTRRIAMKLPNLQKTHLQGKVLQLLLLTFSFFIITSANAQTLNCKSDFSFDVDHDNLEVQLVARSSHYPAAFSWEISDGSSLRGQRTKHSFSSPGEYKVCLTVIAFDSVSNQRCTTRVCKAVEIVNCDRLKAEFDLVQDGMSIAVRGTSNSSNVVYGFSFGDGEHARGQAAKHRYDQRGVYTVCFYAKDTIYGCKTEVCKRVLIDPCSLRAKFDYRQDGNAFKFYAKANDSNVRYVWDFGDGNIGTGDEVGHRYQKPGVYAVCLTVYSKTGTVICDFKTCERVVVEDNDCDLEAKFEFRQDGNDFKFVAKANASPARFVWDFGDGITGYGDEIKHSYDKPGVYEVCLTVYASNTNTNKVCRTKICKRVKIEDENKGCDLRADFDVRIDGKNILVQAKSNQDSVLYFWSFGDMQDGTGIKTKHEYDGYGKYEICLIVFNPRTKCKTCVCKTILIERPCDLKADFKYATYSNKVYFKARSNGSDKSRYYWDYGDGSYGEGEKTRHKYSQRGVYEVTLTVYDPRTECKTSITYKVRIGLQKSVAEETPTKNTDVKGAVSWRANVSPSPARTTVAISSDDKKLSSVKIYAMDGSLALEQQGDLRQIDISKLTKGMYYAHVFADDGTLTIVKFLKE
ncbi:PKD domain-containing protein [bacterium]|nr:PKD domain-containing protein [bacterium]